ncbi:hypothetical protein [Candidatus Colwellia aromaticivorans]|uniref:hypothetical protein n=1 Tax=Candidatus Colwellia aromaticivorans TaxID=2267621 RepID=UPI000DF25511|nr:hypothetical protein [Candidatus Colwellia aromaticivorans]
MNILNNILDLNKESIELVNSLIQKECPYLLDTIEFTAREYAQVIDLIYKNGHIDIYLNLLKSRHNFNNSSSATHFLNSSIIKNLFECSKKHSEALPFLNEVGKEVLDKLSETTKAFLPTLPRHTGLEIYAKFLIEQDRIVELKNVCNLALELGWRGNWKKLANKTKESNKKDTLKAKKITQMGEEAESIARNWLKDNGFTILQFGRSYNQQSSSLDIERLPEINVGSSIINICKELEKTREILPEISPSVLKTSNFPKEFDYLKTELIKLANICQTKFPCLLHKVDPTNAPCNLGEDMFNPDKLATLNPELTTGHKPGCLSISKCQTRLGLVSAVMKDSSFLKNKFLKDNIKVHRFIQRYIVYKNFYETNFKETRKKYKFSQHPGRYDLAAYKGDKYYAVEVKGNSSKLSHWQEIRLGLLKRFGHEARLLKVQFTSDKNYLLEFEDITSKIPLPSDDEIQEILNFVHPSEKGREGAMVDTCIIPF